MQTVFLSRIISRELYTLLSSAGHYPVYRGYRFPEGASLPATIFFMEQASFDGAVQNIPAEHITSGTYRFVVRTDGEGSSDTVIADEAQRLVEAVAGAIVNTDDGYQLTFTALGETPLTSEYAGATEYQRLGVIYQVFISKS